MKEQVTAMYTGNYSLIQTYGIKYISVTKHERYLNINRQFLDSELFSIAYEEILDGEHYLLFKVL
jgi:hypothetical protein